MDAQLKKKSDEIAEAIISSAVTEVLTVYGNTIAELSDFEKDIEQGGSIKK